MDAFLNFIHKGQVVRRAILLWAVWLSTVVSFEMIEYSIKFSEKNGEELLGVAAVIGAILTPVLGLTGWIIKNYAANPSVVEKDQKEG